jgi:hypothetical protein
MNDSPALESRRVRTHPADGDMGSNWRLPSEKEQHIGVIGSGHIGTCILDLV